MITMFSEKISRNQAREWVLSFQSPVGEETVDPFGHVVEDNIFNVQNSSQFTQSQNWNDTLRRVLKLVDCADVSNFSAIHDGQTGAMTGIQFSYGVVVKFVVTPVQHDA